MERHSARQWRTARLIAGVVTLFLGFGCLAMGCTAAVVHGFEAQAGPVDTADVGRWATAGAALVALGVVVLLASAVSTWWPRRDGSP